MFLVDPLHNRLLQVSVFASIVYYLTASPLIFDKARKMFPIKFKKVHHQLLFHTFVFGVLMYLLTYFVFDPALKVFEGNNDLIFSLMRSTLMGNEWKGGILIESSRTTTSPIKLAKFRLAKYVGEMHIIVSRMLMSLAKVGNVKLARCV